MRTHRTGGRAARPAVNTAQPVTGVSCEKGNILNCMPQILNGTYTIIWSSHTTWHQHSIWQPDGGAKAWEGKRLGAQRTAGVGGGGQAAGPGRGRAGGPAAHLPRLTPAQAEEALSDEAAPEAACHGHVGLPGLGKHPAEG